MYQSGRVLHNILNNGAPEHLADSLPVTSPDLLRGKNGDAMGDSKLLAPNRSAGQALDHAFMVSQGRSVTVQRGSAAVDQMTGDCAVKTLL